MTSFQKIIDVETIRETQRARGLATILAIGTATPLSYINQDDYADYYFRVTNTEHMINLKEKFKRICKCHALLQSCNYSSSLNNI
ncbi:putative chalcone synthase [Helianthus anomalus]